MYHVILTKKTYAQFSCRVLILSAEWCPEARINEETACLGPQTFVCAPAPCVVVTQPLFWDGSMAKGRGASVSFTELNGETAHRACRRKPPFYHQSVAIRRAGGEVLPVSHLFT